MLCKSAHADAGVNCELTAAPVKAATAVHLYVVELMSAKITPSQHLLFVPATVAAVGIAGTTSTFCRRPGSGYGVSRNAGKPDRDRHAPGRIAVPHPVASFVLADYHAPPPTN
jgi:hypothetical protein